MRATTDDWRNSTIFVSHDRGNSFSAVPITQRISSIIPSTDRSIIFLLPDPSVNNTYLYVTDDGGHSWATRLMPGRPVVRPLLSLVPYSS